MDFASCPECGQTATRMPVLSYVSLTDNYYKCEACGHVAYQPKTLGTPIRPISFALPPLDARAART